MLSIFLLVLIIFLAVLLITAYVIAPIISWLAATPLGGVALLIAIFILAGILIREEMTED
ncbi:MAG: hypothetical protein PVF96_06900 [Candidatus Bathyarchaeota archaeon]|jgi:hypothetical protein